jgi:phage portal protein BeeE
MDALDRYKGAKNAGKTPILEGGMDYKQLGMSNQDAEWLASRRFTIEDIARMFNVSPIFLQEYSNSTYSNFSEASRAFTDGARGWRTSNNKSNLRCWWPLRFREPAIRWSLTLLTFSAPRQPNVTPLMSAASRTGS